eukprot:37300-Prorocentrum_minimum.AAC.3
MAAPSGLPLWLSSWGGGGADEAFSAAFGEGGNAFVAGAVTSTASFGGAEGPVLTRTSSRTDRDAFLTKVRSSNLRQSACKRPGLSCSQ